jgi:hypothetical protein
VESETIQNRATCFVTIEGPSLLARNACVILRHGLEAKTTVQTDKVIWEPQQNAIASIRRILEEDNTKRSLPA